MAKTVFVLIVLTLLVLSLHGAVAADAFSFATYIGETHWRVDVTENEGACGGSSAILSTHNILIKHNQVSAIVGDYGHGTREGTFVAPFILRMPAMNVPDGRGNSLLDSFDAIFTPDCQSFSAEYTWDYSDEYGFCSGSTKLEGTRTDGAGCPSSGMTNAEMPQENTPSLEQQAADAAPKDFWKNWDAAEKAKKEGKYDDFIKYFDNALNNPSLTAKTREEMKKQALKDLHLSSYPTKTTSPILRVETEDINKWNGGWVYNVNVPVEKKGILDILLWNINTPNPTSIVDALVNP
jgi:hypothetical protein